MRLVFLAVKRCQSSCLAIGVKVLGPRYNTIAQLKSESSCYPIGYYEQRPEQAMHCLRCQNGVKVSGSSYHVTGIVILNNERAVAIID